MLKRGIFIVGLMLVHACLIQAQQTDYLLKRADKAYAALQFESAVRSYEQYLEANPSKTALTEKIADCYWNLRNYPKASLWYAKTAGSAATNSDVVKKRMAELNAMDGKYQEANKILSSLNGFQSRANGFVNTSIFRRDSADWTISDLSINTQAYREFSPLVLGNKFIWSSNQPQAKGIKGIMGWDANGYVRQFYLSSLDHVIKVVSINKIDTSRANQHIKYAKHFSGADISTRENAFLPTSVVNQSKYRQHLPLLLGGFEKTKYNIGHATASSITQKIYASVNEQGDLSDSAVRKISIVEGDVNAEGVSNIHFLPLGFEGYNLMHPAIHPNGEFMVFSSDAPGGKGGYDLYSTKKSADGKWSSPLAIQHLNTKGNEVFATFDASGKDLYFSSDGMPGLGGLDIYKVGFANGSVAGNPSHLSYPLNTQYDEFGFTSGVKGDAGYFTSDRNGSDDVFAFSYQKVYTPVTGFVIEESTGLRAPAVPVALYGKEEDGSFAKVDSMSTDKNGNYFFPVARPNRIYQVVAYPPRSIKNDFKGIATLTTPAIPANAQAPVILINQTSAPKAPVQEPVLAKAPTPPSVPEAAKPGLVLDSVYFIIYFDFDKYALTPTSLATLNRAIAFLKSNPGFGFILLGHTDLKGNVDYNIKLSKNRVYAANNYMASKGIDSTRFKLEYYGKSHPAKSGLTDDDGRLNRRVEFILIKK